ncbi:MAG: hypothetical protein NWF01_11140 [Candidatus Bathyarchaeota archaeon]|nr:hypothetical protein [Candidatus Bathyarchaeota archaeon]
MTEKRKQTEKKWWLINHNLTVYRIFQEKDGRNIIINLIDKNNEPLDPNFKNISNGNLIVYYSNFEKVIVGIFKVISDKGLSIKGNRLYENIDWDFAYFKIEPLKQTKYFIDITSLQPKVDTFDRFPDGLLYEEFKDSYSICRLLEDKDFDKFAQICANKNYAKRYTEETTINLFTSLLDFYGNKAASFANLFLVSIFGIVTLSAIIRTTSGIPTAISIIPFLIFSILGLYTLNKYTSYGNRATAIKGEYIDEQHYDSLNNLIFYDSKEKKYKGYSDFFNNQKGTAITDKKKHSYRKVLYANSSLKKLYERFFERNGYFIIWYVAILVTLAFVVYWDKGLSSLLQDITNFLSQIRLS